MKRGESYNRITKLGRDIGQNPGQVFQLPAIPPLPGLRLNVLDRAVNNTTGLALPKSAFDGLYRTALPGQDELFSTASTHRLIQGLMNGLARNQIPNTVWQHWLKMIDLISSLRIPTKFSGHSTSSSVMQHPTGVGEGFFSALGVAGRHGTFDSARVKYIGEALRASEQAGDDPENQLYAATRAALEFSLNYFTAPVTASNVHPFSTKAAVPANHPSLREQVEARESIKIIYGQLGGALRNPPAIAETPAEGLSRRWQLDLPITAQNPFPVAPPSPRRTGNSTASAQSSPAATLSPAASFATQSPPFSSPVTTTTTTTTAFAWLATSTSSPTDSLFSSPDATQLASSGPSQAYAPPFIQFTGRSLSHSPSSSPDATQPPIWSQIQAPLTPFTGRSLSYSPSSSPDATQPPNWSQLYAPLTPLAGNWLSFSQSPSPDATQLASPNWPQTYVSPATGGSLILPSTALDDDLVWGITFATSLAVAASQPSWASDFERDTQEEFSSTEVEDRTQVDERAYFGDEEEDVTMDDLETQDPMELLLAEPIGRAAGTSRSDLESQDSLADSNAFHLILPGNTPPLDELQSPPVEEEIDLPHPPQNPPVSQDLSDTDVSTDVSERSDTEVSDDELVELFI